MSQENVETVRQAFAAFGDGGTEAILRFAAPDCVWYPIADWVEEATYRGHDGIRELVAWVDDFDDPSWELNRVRDDGDRVLVQADLTGRIRASGAPIRQSFSAICSSFREGTIGEMRYFRTWDEAIRAAGLPE